MTTFITKLDAAGTGPRVAVKDIIDVKGVPTTGGSRALQRIAKAAEHDAACLAGLRAAGARIVGKANLHELAVLPLGTNPWFGTPVNPLDAALIPGGSSSGSAVAVAAGDADVALGSDTGGSIRVPAACCGVTGLKTTYGRVPLEGVWPLAPSFDTIGPMSAAVAGLVTGMELLEPGFAPAAAPARTIGRLRTTALPEIEAAVDGALRTAGLDVVTVDWDGFEAGTNLFTAIYFDEVETSDGGLAAADPDGIGHDIHQALALVDMFRPGAADARRDVPGWRESLLDLFGQVDLLALPAIPVFPYSLDALDSDDAVIAACIEITRYTSLFNVAGVPCTAQPVPAAGSALPASLQLVGPMWGEELLVSTAQLVETALRP